MGVMPPSVVGRGHLHNGDYRTALRLPRRAHHADSHAARFTLAARAILRKTRRQGVRMRPNIVSLRQFYASPLGRLAKQRLRQLVMQLWPEHGQEVIVGLGYAVPVLRVLERAKPAALVALMPADQGAIYWPVHSENHSVLADELMPPFAPSTLHRVVMLHAFEHAPRPKELLQVYWHMLAPGGRLLLIVPNRRGFWASFGTTPFTHGTPYSLSQLKELLAATQFTLREARAALFAPPGGGALWLRSWKLLDRVGRWCFPAMGGVLLIDAEKQIYASIPEPVKAKMAWKPALGAVAQPSARLNA